MTAEVTTENISDIALIHKKNLPSLLAYYPVKFIEKFYLNQLTKESSVFICFRQENEIAGFVFGTTDLKAMFESFIAENKFYFILETFKVLLKRPEYILYLAESFLLKKENPHDSQTQLVYIASSKNHEKKGIGKSLLEAFEKEIKLRENHYELEVEQNNPALSFYQKNGFQTVREINNILEKKFLMRKNFKINRSGN